MISRISMGRSLIVVAIFESDNAFLDTRVERSEKITWILAGVQYFYDNFPLKQGKKAKKLF